jgi:hypothetical protein
LLAPAPRSATIAFSFTASSFDCESTAFWRVASHATVVPSAVDSVAHASTQLPLLAPHSHPEMGAVAAAPGTCAKTKNTTNHAVLIDPPPTAHRSAAAGPWCLRSPSSPPALPPPSRARRCTPSPSAARPRREARGLALAPLLALPPPPVRGRRVAHGASITRRVDSFINRQFHNLAAKQFSHILENLNRGIQPLNLERSFTKPRLIGGRERPRGPYVALRASDPAEHRSCARAGPPRAVTPSSKLS